MIQDIGKGRYRNEYRNRYAAADDKVIVCKKRDPFLRFEGTETSFLTYQETIDKLPCLKDQETYLFELDGVSYFTFRYGAAGDTEIADLFDSVEFDSAAWGNFRDLRKNGPSVELFAAETAAQLIAWYDNRRICPHCGKPMEHSPKERMMQCPSCRLMEYPKISPAVIVAVTNGDRILLTKYAGRGFTNYALIAGFNEIGESIEETVHREVMEEVGVKVKNLRYYKSQPWSFTDTLLFGFFCELDGDDIIRLDQEELAVGEWVKREDVPDNDGISLTREMMSVFKNQK